MPADKDRYYQRGGYWLDLDRGRGGVPRGPNFFVWRYDERRRRLISTTTGTADLTHAMNALDAIYLRETGGAAVCTHCGQPLPGASDMLVADAIADYKLRHGNSATSSNAIRARLDHVLDYIETLPNPAVACADVDEEWIKRFRAWLSARPIVAKRKDGSAGKSRSRKPGTVENSVLQLAAAISAVPGMKARFRAFPLATVNESPRWRASGADLAAMLRWCMDKGEHGTALRRFLILSIGTLARPDAVMEFSTDPKREQWDAAHGLIYLNPKGRKQTKKYRATVRCPRLLRPWIDATEGQFVRNRRAPIASVVSPWSTMCKDLGFPAAGSKDIRRSMASLIRGQCSNDELELQMGHSGLDPSTATYAPFQPSYLAGAFVAIESIMDQIETFVPGAFHREITGRTGNVVPLSAAKGVVNA